MKKILLIIICMLALIACNKNNEPQQSSDDNNPSDTIPQDTVPQDPVAFSVALSYDSVANIVTAVPSDTDVEYVLQVWMVQDYVLDYGNDFSDAHVKESLQDYLDMCIAWEMSFPTFTGTTTMDVYEWFDQPYPGEEFIAMAASFNLQTRKIEGRVEHIFFTTPE